MIKFSPMLYSAPMVQGILEDRKNQTRRTKGLENLSKTADIIEIKLISEDDKTWLMVRTKYKGTYKINCPYHIGNVLWVRETLYQNCELGLEYDADCKEIDENIIPIDFNVRVDKNGNYKFCKIPSIYMEKWACRIFLEITNIRVERLQDICEYDAINEGIKTTEARWLDEDKTHYLLHTKIDKYSGVTTDPIRSYQTLWEVINGKESWNNNPFVWVIEFKRIEKPNDFIL